MSFLAFAQVIWRDQGDFAHSVAGGLPGAGVWEWLINAGGAGVFGLLLGAVIVGVLHLLPGKKAH